MTGTRVSGMYVGLSASTPTGLTASSTNAEKVTAYEALIYTFPNSCIVTQLPIFDEFWETNEDELTVCNNTEEIVGKYKTRQKVADSSVSAIFVKDDPIIVLFNTLRESATDIGTLVVGHSNGTDKIWAQIEVTKTTEDATDTVGKVKFMAEFFFKKKPVRN